MKGLEIYLDNKVFAFHAKVLGSVPINAKKGGKIKF